VVRQAIEPRAGEPLRPQDARPVFERQVLAAAAAQTRPRATLTREAPGLRAASDAASSRPRGECPGDNALLVRSWLSCGYTLYTV
jgi:hypothetical protein